MVLAERMLGCAVWLQRHRASCQMGLRLYPLGHISAAHGGLSINGLPAFAHARRMQPVVRQRIGGDMRVLVAGFKHETNSFGAHRADWAAFERGEVFPKPAHGQAMLEMIDRVDLSATGFVRQA